MVKATKRKTPPKAPVQDEHDSPSIQHRFGGKFTKRKPAAKFEQREQIQDNHAERIAQGHNRMQTLQKKKSAYRNFPKKRKKIAKLQQRYQEFRGERVALPRNTVAHTHGPRRR